MNHLEVNKIHSHFIYYGWKSQSLFRLWSVQQVAVCVVRRVQAAWAGQMRADAVDAALQRWGFGLAACVRHKKALFAKGPIVVVLLAQRFGRAAWHCAAYLD